MKQIFLISLLSLFLGISSGFAQSAKLVVTTSGQIKGKYLGENRSQYKVEWSDIYWVPKRGHKVVTYSAANGQGYVHVKYGKGAVNVRQQPNTNSPVVAKIVNAEEAIGDIDEGYRCLGKSGNWYKIQADGKVGFVRSDLVEWDWGSY